MRFRSKFPGIRTEGEGGRNEEQEEQARGGGLMMMRRGSPVPTREGEPEPNGRGCTREEGREGCEWRCIQGGGMAAEGRHRDIN